MELSLFSLSKSSSCREYIMSKPLTQNNTTTENRIGINTITPDENIHVSGGTIKTQDLIVLGDLSVNNFSSDLIPRDDLSYNIGSIDYRWNDLLK